MKELLRTNNAVLISVLRSLLAEAEIAHLVLDENMSIVEGSLGILPRRVLVEESRMDEARALLIAVETRG